MGFWNGSEKRELWIADEPITVDKRVYDYVIELENELNDYKRQVLRLSTEINELVPLLKDKPYGPAISKDCKTCRYCVIRNSRVLGCMKNNVCEDYQKENMA